MKAGDKVIRTGGDWNGIKKGQIYIGQMMFSTTGVGQLVPLLQQFLDYHSTDEYGDPK